MCQRGETGEVYLKRGTVRVDACLKEIIQELNDKGIITLGCCCGHGKYPRTIICLEDDGRFACREIGDIYEWYSSIIIKRKRKFYSKDAIGFYYLPESC